MIPLHSSSSSPAPFMAEADWSKLPKDLLRLISQNLNSEFYQLRFRSVCSSWRSSSVPKNHLLNLPSKLTFAFDSNNNNNNAPTFPLSKRAIFLITPTPNQQQTLNPWLIKIGPHSHGRTRLWHPLLRDKQFPLHFPQHINFNQLSVRDLGHEFIIGSCSTFRDNLNSFFNKNVVVSDTLHNGNHLCSVLLTIHFSGKLAIFRSSDEQWTIMPEMPPKFYTDVCVFNGRLIAADSTGRTVAVGPDLSLDLVAEAVFGGDTKILVESDGELLLVDKYLKPCMNVELSLEGQGVYEVRIIESAVRFVVFRLDEKEKKWVELTNLGDRVLFLGENCAFSVSASDLGMENGNCVIFIDNVDLFLRSTELGISVFCLDKRQISPLSDFPCCSKLFRPPPQWVGLC